MSDAINLRQFTHNSLYTFLRQGIGITLGLLTSVLLARGLGTEGRGIYALALLLPNLMTTFSNLGVNVASVYYIARDIYKPATVIKENIALSLWIGAFGVSIGYLLVYFGHTAFFPDVPYGALMGMLIIIPINLLSGNLTSVLQGLQDFKSYNFVVLIPQFITLILLFLFVWILRWDEGGALIAYGWGRLISVGIILMVLGRYKSIEIQVKFIPSKEYTAHILSYGIKSYISNVVVFLNYRADMFILNYLAGATSVGLYSVAIGLVERIWVISRAVSTVLFPKIASMDSLGKDRSILTTMIARYVLWVNILLGLFFLLFSNLIIVFLYGKDYTESATILKLILPGIVLGGMSRVLSNDIAGRGRPGINTIHSSIALAINIVANILLVPRMGARGAALASSISYSSVVVMKVITFSIIAQVPWYTVWLITKEDIQRWKKLVSLLKGHVVGLIII